MLTVSVSAPRRWVSLTRGRLRCRHGVPLYSGSYWLSIECVAERPTVQERESDSAHGGLP